MLPYLTDPEIDGICEGRTQPAAMVRFIRDELGLPVVRKPNGRPLVWRVDIERRASSTMQGQQARGPKWSRE